MIYPINVVIALVLLAVITTPTRAQSDDGPARWFLFIRSSAGVQSTGPLTDEDCQVHELAMSQFPEAMTASCRRLLEVVQCGDDRCVVFEGPMPPPLHRPQKSRRLE